MDWFAAEAYCSNLVYAGYDDWRLPSIAQVGGGAAELDTLFSANGNPSGAWEGFVGTPFTDVQIDYYWSTATTSSYYMQVVSMQPDYYSRFSGYGTEFSCSVWPVRGGQKPTNLKYGQ